MFISYHAPILFGTVSRLQPARDPCPRVNFDLDNMSSDCWQELVDQVRKGARPEDAAGIKVPQQNFSAEEFWQRLVVKGVGDTPLSFLPPDLSRLLEGATPVPQEELVVLPPCLCLDTVLQPEFVLPPAQLAQGVEGSTSLPPAQGVESSTSLPPAQLAQGVECSTSLPPAQGVECSTSLPPAQGVEGSTSLPPAQLAQGVECSTSLPPSQLAQGVYIKQGKRKRESSLELPSSPETVSMSSSRI